ncbi:L-aspartate oxidase [Gordonia sp. NB41Y]|uniref:L-aspartate oxidase n=1 Tax=Gordonia sp. NB41Y TaxID=875808 RepID=UPI00273CC386|nr:L-aspartate oxidase [Gordonia sp. NB41Y]WLP88846.1 L-aspartate oxidase [Gordonia sp. NB41Y]
MSGVTGGAVSTSADLVVVGAGVAGLTAALSAAALGLRVVVVHKGPRWDADRAEQATSTFYAQGGVAVVAPDDPLDSVRRHLDDTLAAGAGLTDAAASGEILAGGWAAVAELIGRGARFDRDATGAYARTREGGHSVRRILHAGGDATGAHLQRTLGAALTAARATGEIDCRDDTFVTRVLTDVDGRVAGLACRTILAGGGHDGGVRDEVVTAPTVLLATGGVGHLYPATTNPAGATGDGIGLALRAGARVADLEFIQFHPTMLFTGGERGRRTLITEALRGEGGRLVDAGGRSVTADVHPLGDLAPRDVVANAVWAAMDRTGEPCVYLDVTGVDDVERRFPTVTAGVRAAGLDITSGRIPVVPGAHYLCGGVVTDTETRTSVPGLLAAGEVARTGLHGGNRLASNSLLEGLVMGGRAAVVAAAQAGGHHDRPVGHGASSVAPVPELLPALERTALQDAMGRHVGLRRDASGLAEVATLLQHAPRREMVTVADAEDASLTLVASAVVAAASARAESRGSHVRSDFPHTADHSGSRIFALAGGVVTEIGSDELAVSPG